jgi:hypothetical protein
MLDYVETAMPCANRQSSLLVAWCGVVWDEKRGFKQPLFVQEPLALRVTTPCALVCFADLFRLPAFQSRR